MNPSAKRLKIGGGGCPAFVAIVLTMFIPLPAFAQKQETAGQSARIDPALLEELKALDARLVKVADLQADFVQTKHVALLKKPLKSEGVLRVKASQMRWDTLKPEPSTTLTGPKEIRIHFPKQRVVEVYRVDDRLASIIMTPLPRLHTLLEHFDPSRLAARDDDDEETKGLLGIRLSPRSDAIKAHLDHVNVWIDRRSAVSPRMEMVDVDGDRTMFKLANIKVNGGLDDKVFVLDLPAGTRIVRPLEAGDRRRSEQGRP